MHKDRDTIDFAKDPVRSIFRKIRKIEWDALGGKPRPLFHQPHMSEDTLIPIYAKP